MKNPIDENDAQLSQFLSTLPSGDFKIIENEENPKNYLSAEISEISRIELQNLIPNVKKYIDEFEKRGIGLTARNSFLNNLFGKFPQYIEVARNQEIRQSKDSENKEQFKISIKNEKGALFQQEVVRKLKDYINEAVIENDEVSDSATSIMKGVRAKRIGNFLESYFKSQVEKYINSDEVKQLNPYLNVEQDEIDINGKSYSLLLLSLFRPDLSNQKYSNILEAKFNKV